MTLSPQRIGWIEGCVPETSEETGGSRPAPVRAEAVVRVMRAGAGGELKWRCGDVGGRAEHRNSAL